MLSEPIHILLADDKKEICDSLEENLLVHMEKFGLEAHDVIFVKSFTEHAYAHGCRAVSDGFKPNVCIFGLIFNGFTGLDLYKYINAHLPNKKIDYCIYTGVDKGHEKMKEAEVMASETGGMITIIQRPNISELLDWFSQMLERDYCLVRQVDEHDPFDVL